MILMVGIPLAFHQFSSTSRVAEKAFYLMIFLTITIGIILTGSRGGFVTFLGIISLIFFRKPSASGCFGVIAVGSILALFANDAFWARMGTLISGHEEHGSSLSQRTELLKGAFSIFLDNPLFGVGPGNFGRGLVARGISRGEGSSAVLSEDLSVNFGVAHNMHLEVLAETGICGALLFWSICFLSLAGMSRYDRVLRSSSSDFSLAFAFFAALLSMLFFGLFLSQGKNTVLWFLLGVGFAMGRLSTLAGASRGITEKASRFGTRVQDFAKTLHTGTSTG
jgi:O-antigen ligase